MKNIVGVNTKSLTMMLVAIHAGAAQAQEQLYFIPSISVYEVYDDNVFFTISDEQSDLTTRITPAIEAGYESETAQWNGRYSFDSEKYKTLDSLDSDSIRRFADLSVSLFPSNKLTVTTDAHYTRTNTPVDLSLVGNSLIQGLAVGRLDAERLSVKPGLEYRFTPQSIGSMAYTLTNDKLFDTIDSDTHLYESSFAHTLSENRIISIGYDYRRYQFDLTQLPDSNAASRVTQDTHTPWVGLQHNFSERTNFSGRVGPRISDSSTDPYLLLSLHHTFPNADLDASYEFNDTTLLGEVGRLEAQTFALAFSYRAGEILEFQVVPGYARVSRDNYAVNIYSVRMNANYKISDFLYLSASYNMNYQNLNFSDNSKAKVSRNVFVIGLTLTFPRRSDRQPRNA